MGWPERKNRHLLEVARCLMFSSNVPNYFWGEAILTATYLINPSSDLPLKVFGCTAFIHVYPQNRSKFAPRANKCIFLGYSPTQKGYKCYSPTNKRFLHHHGHHPIGNYVTYEGLSPSYRAFATSLDDTQVPNTIQEALKISEWKKAIQMRLMHLRRMGRDYHRFAGWEEARGVQVDFHHKIQSRWINREIQGSLVARGFTQSYGIDYQETFAPVAKLNTIRILLSLAVNQDWCLQQLDIKNAFLNGDLEEEVYMEIPPGFEESMAKNQVCKLQKSCTALKQSPRAWLIDSQSSLKLGYKQGQAYHTLFVKKSHVGKMVILIVYVDDIILSGNDMEELQNLKKYLSEEFEVKDLGI
ncbi:Retrovirus-related Pol polyprotein from transposon RE1 [Vitis vinifera]|uniref:Retrovirus-related Pol polyprotein from transposon RE1 n=1 Tax=Vitis vinifera TaxID=29760 RepID=A0A438G6G4_VITVI|nr:Retrovirus-related Pol polyprotein from transposon RE1 [Vitis vinifera]